MFKLILYWNVMPPGNDEEYFAFLSHELGPTLVKLGIRPTDAWFTVYGDDPQVRIGGVADDLDTIRRALESEQWQQVYDKLLDYVTDYRYKIVSASGEFQL
ncbi:MAG TPA: hypothetical protein ENK56_07190 [Chloroflexi bacterium]|nr:hypothetical protein [Chloroflexota bacterium]